jgi:hypothetical protein
MADTVSLSDLVLGAFRRKGALIDPPAYGVHEVLLPDEEARQLGTNAHQRIAFAPDLPPDGIAAEVLHFGHPLVEAVISDLRRQPAAALQSIRNVRLEKPFLYDTVDKALSFPNAKLFPNARSSERWRLHHYAVFAFRISLIADEKREMILPMWMNVQGGHPVDGEGIERVAGFDAGTLWDRLEPAAVRWMDSPPGDPISEEVLRLLLERARKSAGEVLGDTLKSQQVRLNRLLELDRARLQQYYDDLVADLDRRIGRAEPDRRVVLNAKRDAVETERAAKLRDAEQKYALRIELDLAAMALVAQPKLELDVEIRRRTVATRRTAVWDPLLHQVEPLVCDVCGRPGTALLLCEHGHLAHGGCMAPQCIDCKRAYCRRCTDRMSVCSVCGRPVCLHSCISCVECGRITCQAHAGLCHAVAVPTRPLMQETGADRKPPTSSSHLQDGKAPAKSSARADKIRRTKPEPGSRSKPQSRPPQTEPQREMISSRLQADRMDVSFDVVNERLRAIVYRRGRPVCERSWDLVDEGILTECRCEAEDCREDGMVYRPAESGSIKSQMEWFVHLLMLEYTVPEERTRYLSIRKGKTSEEKGIRLGGLWKDEEMLAEMRAEFDAESRRHNKQGM